MGKIKKNADYHRMNHLKVLVAIFIGTFVYVAVAFVAGGNGILSYSKLEEQKKQITRQTEQIQNINNELNLEYTALLRDKDVISAYARKLGYVSAGEKLVKINGLKSSGNALYDTGSVLRHTDSECLPEKFCKVAGLVFFVLTMVLMVLIDINNGTFVLYRKKKTIIQGIPVYDLQQV